MIKIRDKKETIKVPYVLVSIVLVFKAYAFPYVVLILVPIPTHLI